MNVAGGDHGRRQRLGQRPAQPLGRGLAHHVGDEDDVIALPADRHGAGADFLLSGQHGLDLGWLDPYSVQFYLVIGPAKELHLPAASDGRLVVQDMQFKPYPAETSSLALLGAIPEFRAWTQVIDIATIQIELSHSSWMETSDPPKWDPRNIETADHSMPYLIVRALIDGEVYLDSFTPEKLMDPVARALLQKTTVVYNPELQNHERSRMTVRTKTGRELTKEVTYFKGHLRNPMSREEHAAKFTRVCDHMHVEPRQRDRAQAQWSDLRVVKDIAEPIQNLAKFGRPLPL